MTIIKEFIDALTIEISVLKKGEGGSIVTVYNGEPKGIEFEPTYVWFAEIQWVKGIFLNKIKKQDVWLSMAQSIR